MTDKTPSREQCVEWLRRLVPPNADYPTLLAVMKYVSAPAPQPSSNTLDTCRTCKGEKVLRAENINTGARGETVCPDCFGAGTYPAPEHSVQPTPRDLLGMSSERVNKIEAFRREFTAPDNEPTAYRSLNCACTWDADDNLVDLCEAHKERLTAPDNEPGVLEALEAAIDSLDAEASDYTAVLQRLATKLRQRGEG